WTGHPPVGTLIVAVHGESSENFGADLVSLPLELGGASPFLRKKLLQPIVRTLQRRRQFACLRGRVARPSRFGLGLGKRLRERLLPAPNLLIGPLESGSGPLNHGKPLFALSLGGASTLGLVLGPLGLGHGGGLGIANRDEGDASGDDQRDENGERSEDDAVANAGRAGGQREDRL